MKRKLTWDKHIDNLEKTTDNIIASRMLDPLWRIQNLYPIIDKSGQKIPLSLNPFQESLLIKYFQGNRVLRVLKARQLGITTFFQILFLDIALHYPNTSLIVLAHKRESLEKIFEKTRFAFYNIPERVSTLMNYNVDRGGGSKYELGFPDTNSKIYTSLEVRSTTPTAIHFSEIAFMDKEKTDATKASMSKFTFSSEETTPNSLNHFYDSWIEQKKHKTEGVEQFFFPWFQSPEYQIPITKMELTLEEQDYHRKFPFLTLSQLMFRRQKIADFGGRVDMFEQEYPSDDLNCFLSSGTCPFSKSYLFEYREKFCKSPIRTNYNIFYFDKPEKDNYYMGIDPATGSGMDFSSLVIISAKKQEVVCTLKGQITTSDLSIMARDLAVEFESNGGTCHILIESNGIGQAVIDNMLYNERCKHTLIMDKLGKFGFKTTKDSKGKITGMLMDSINNQDLILNDSRIVDECLTLITNDSGGIEADEGKHDDIFIATCLANYAMVKFRRFVGADYFDKKDNSKA